jgi:hypothetical protein
MSEQTQKIDAQHALDELFSEHLIPFELSAYAVEPIGLQEYMIRFHDSRVNSVIVSWYQGLSFKDVCRTAVLERVKSYSGPLPHQILQN